MRIRAINLISLNLAPIWHGLHRLSTLSPEIFTGRFILVYQKTNPLQTMQALQFEMSQPQANYWIHQLLPLLQQALVALDLAPERDATRLATSPLILEGAPAGAIDGTERRRQRPKDAQLQKEHYSGKKKT